MRLRPYSKAPLEPAESGHESALAYPGPGVRSRFVRPEKKVQLARPLLQEPGIPGLPGARVCYQAAATAKEGRRAAKHHERCLADAARREAGYDNHRINRLAIR